MNIKKTVVFATLLVTNSLFGQTLIETKNGVNIYQSIGVERNETSFTKQVNPSKNIEDWNLAECDKAIEDIKSKISTLNNQDKNYEEQLKIYLETILKIENRKKLILENK